MLQSTATPIAATSPDPLDTCWASLRPQLLERLQQFRRQSPTPQTAATLEHDLQAVFQAAARDLLQHEFQRAEPADKTQVPLRVRYRGQTYRVNKRTPATIATTFGPLTLWSFLYLADEPGEPGLHPLHVQLGVLAGCASGVLAERVAHWAVDHSQSAVRQLVQAEHGLVWSNDRLRAVLRAVHRSVVTQRADTQQQRLLHWLDVAERSRGRHRPVLAVGRDGIMIPLRGRGYQEASTATLSVYNRRGKRLGTVYLGQMPESHQTTLSQELTSLLTATLRQWSGPQPRLVYVTDKGQAQDDYYRRVLRRWPDPRRPGQRLAWEWVLDFFHVSGYVAQLRQALFGARGQRWGERMRHWLRWRKGGVTQLLRSAVAHYQQRTLSAAAERLFWKAYRYLRRHSRYMAYARYSRLGLPVGSGVTEAACKTLFTQRLKRSGMRWSKEFGQLIVDLRVLQLSGVWAAAVQQARQSQPLPEKVSCTPRPSRNQRKAS